METSSCKPAELVTVVFEQKEARPKTPPQLLLPVLYGLNRSFTKKIYMGLEIDAAGQAEIKIRLIGADYVGVGFDCGMWQNFANTFDIVSKYFESGRKNREMLDQKLVGCGFSVRFVISHMDKAIEVEEEVGARVAKKKHRRSVILKENTFAVLRQYRTLINSRIEHLKSWLAASISSWARLCSSRRKITIRPRRSEFATTAC